MGEVVVSYDYQLEDLPPALGYLIRDCRLLLAYCVASGKTKMALALASLLVRRGVVTHVVILCPTDTVKQQFLDEAGIVMTGFDGPIEFLPFFQPEAQRGTHQRSLGNRFLDYLATGAGTVQVCSYNIFRDQSNRDAKYAAIDKLGDKLLIVIDETHHVLATDEDAKDAKLTSKVVNRCTRARRLGLSGTPERSDGSLVYTDDWPVIRRVLSEHMMDPAEYTPRSLLFDIEEVKSGAEEDADFAYVPADKEQAIPVILKHMERDHWPKSIIRCKSSADRAKNQNLVQSIESALTTSGRSFTSLYGATDREDTSTVMRKRVEACLASENPRNGHRYDELSDAIVTIRRAEEGANFPSRSHLYLLGCPQSMQALEQLFGRVLRARVRDGMPLYAGYPDEWLRRSKVVFVIAEQPGLGGISTVLFRATMFISTLETSLFLREALIVHDGFRRLPRDEQKALLRKHRVSLDEIAAVTFCEKQVRATFRTTASSLHEKQLDTQALTKIIVANGNEIIRRAVSRGIYPDFKPVEITAECVGRVFSANQLRDPKARDNFRKSIDSFNGSIDDGILAGLQEAREVFENGAARSVDNTKYEIDGWLAEDIATVARVSGGSKMIGFPTSAAEILSAVDAFRAANKGRYPLLTDLDGETGRTFLVYDSVLRAGKFGRIIFTRYETGLAGLVLGRDGASDWFQTLTEVSEAVDRREMSSESDFSQVILGGEAGVRREYGHIPEVAYYFGAWKATRRYREHDDKLRQLTIDEADRIGKESPVTARRVLSTGVEATRTYLRDGVST